MKRLNPLAMLLALVATVAASVIGWAQNGSSAFPTYTVGPQPNGTYIVSDGAIIHPAGT
jgi:hypothetical protein